MLNLNGFGSPKIIGPINRETSRSGRAYGVYQKPAQSRSAAVGIGLLIFFIFLLMFWVFG